MKMKRIVLVVLTVIAVICSSSCKKDKTSEPTVVEIALSKTSITLTIGEERMLSVAVIPEGAYKKEELVWKSERESVAMVNQEGVVSAVGEGRTNITVSTPDGKYSDACMVKVDAEEIAVTSITLDKDVLHMLAGTTYKLTATITPEDATDKTIAWVSVDESIATVDQEGLVTAVTDGEVEIFATVGACRAVCKVIVEAIEFGYYKTEGIIGVGDKLSMRPYLLATFDPDWSKVTLTSDNSEIAEVTDDFTIIGKSQGVTTIKASYEYNSELVLNSDFEIEVEDSFLTFVEDVFSISSRGVVASSTIYSGSVSVGDKVRVVRADQSLDDLELTVSDIELYRKRVETAYRGDKVSILFGDSSVSKDDLPCGSIIMSPQTKRVLSTKLIYGTVVITGKDTPIVEGYIAKLDFNGIVLDAKIIDLIGRMISKGETYYNVGFEFTGGDVLPCFLGGEIKIMEGDSQIGTCIIEDIN